MTGDDANAGQPIPIQLTQQQQDVIRALQSRESDIYPLSQWYLGALYALVNPHNPDRFSQAAQSFRELVEKLPEVVLEGDLQIDSYDLREIRRQLTTRIVRDRQRYQDGWNGKSIDEGLAETLEEASTYFEKSEQPSRREQILMSVVSIDPLASQLDMGILNSKRDRILEASQVFQKVAHHRGIADEKEFARSQEVLDRIILDLLAPITAQDQQEIRSILVRPDRTASDEERLFTLIERRGANYRFFFEQASDPSWIPLLRNNGLFSSPPDLERVADKQWNASYWWPLNYLSRAASHDPETVVEVILALPDIDNPRIKTQVLDIARKLPGVQSARLKPKILVIGQRDFPLMGHWYTELLVHWVRQNEIQAAQELAEVLVGFEPDPQLDHKRDWYKEHGLEGNPPVSPVPRVRDWEYRQMFEQAVEPLAEREPIAMARMLASTVDKMIQLRTQAKSQDETGEEDLSEAWCRRLNRIDDNYEEPSNVLVKCLTLACETVFETFPDSSSELDQILRGYPWRIFNRLRQHLYARYPNDQTKEWIREFLLKGQDYSSGSHRFEFQQMVRGACEHFDSELLTEAEMTDIFDAVLAGPSRESYLERWGEEFTEERFDRRKRLFHRMQLRPFSSVLFGTYADYFQALESQGEQAISDDNYMPIGDSVGGTVLPQSPLSLADFNVLTDREILDYINQWDEEYWYAVGEGRRGGIVEVSIEGLANAFRDFFREHIMLDDGRLGYWVKHLDEINRTIYVRAIVTAFDEYLKQGGLDRIEESIKACEWVLSHSDDDTLDGLRDGEQARDTSHWRNARRAAGDFVATCLEEKTEVPLLFEEELSDLLELLCTQFDYRLDRNVPVRLDRFDAYDEAINNTRSKALGSLIQFGFWLRKEDPEADICFVTTTLEKRFSPDAEFPLSLPEYGMLGENYVRLLILHPDWTAEHGADIFPQLDSSSWRAAFGSFLRMTPKYTDVFETLKSQFWFAIENMPRRSESSDTRSILIDGLSEHLFIYYLRALYPLRGEESLLERFYQKTSGRTDHWGTLFRHVGFVLRHTEKLDQSQLDQIADFFEWRLAQENAEELKEFWMWLESECLDAEWRLDAFSRTLDLSRPDTTHVYGEVDRLDALLSEHLPGVLKCFAKLTDKIDDDLYSIPTDPAKRILKVGLESTQADVRQNAELAHDNLLRRGRSDLLDIDS